MVGEVLAMLLSKERSSVVLGLGMVQVSYGHLVIIEASDYSYTSLSGRQFNLMFERIRQIVEAV